MNQMVLRFLSIAENVGLARLAVTTFAGQTKFSINDLEEIKVAVSEAVSNAIIHGYPGQEDGWVEVRCVLDNEGLIVAVEDWGVGIGDVEQAREPSYSRDPERMGLGFVFMESFMHGLEVESHLGQGTRVEMRRFVTLSGELSRDAQ